MADYIVSGVALFFIIILCAWRREERKSYQALIERYRKWTKIDPAFKPVLECLENCDWAGARREILLLMRAQQMKKYDSIKGL